MTQSPQTPRTGTSKGLLLAGSLFVGVLLGLGALYGMKGGRGNAPLPAAQQASCEASRPKVEKLSSIARGEVASLKINMTPQPATPVSFFTHDGKPLTLGNFAGKVVLLNLWATWCAPCRAEMPALDRLQAELGGPDFEVVAVNIDTTRLERPKAFLKEVGVSRLAYYQDQSANIFAELKKAGKAFGMPTTLLIDSNGCELGTMAGPAEWSSPDAFYVIRTALGR